MSEIELMLNDLRIAFEAVASTTENALAAVCLVSVTADVPFFAAIVSTFNTLVIRYSNIR
jgi:hypothetical protein